MFIIDHRASTKKLAILKMKLSLNCYGTNVTNFKIFKSQVKMFVMINYNYNPLLNIENCEETYFFIALTLEQIKRFITKLITNIKSADVYLRGCGDLKINIVIVHKCLFSRYLSNLFFNTCPLSYLYLCVHSTIIIILYSVVVVLKNNAKLFH